MAGNNCLGCGGNAVVTLLDFGSQPPSNRFVPVGGVDTDRHPLKLGQCGNCGLVQLINPMPVSMVRSRHDWLTYNEPEGHLDALVKQLSTLRGLGPQSRIVGLTYKDDTTLARFNRLGFSNTFRFDPKSDFGIDDPGAGLETIQGAATDAGIAGRLVARHGKADLLIVRHVLEHAHDPAGFLRALGQLIAPGGHLVFEMPDCRKFMDACDYSFVWEEHITYFSPRTLGNFLQQNGFAAADTFVYPYPLEDSLVAVVQPVTGAAPLLDPIAVNGDLLTGRKFAESFGPTAAFYRNHIEALQKAGKRVAVFGAGHLAAKFLNLFSLGYCVECVIDDNPHKQGLAMPGSGLPVVGSATLPRIDLCMLSLSPESEQKVLAKHQAYLQEGGSFASIFSLSPLALKRP